MYNLSLSQTHSVNLRTEWFLFEELDGLLVEEDHSLLYIVDVDKLSLHESVVPSPSGHSHRHLLHFKLLRLHFVTHLSQRQISSSAGMCVRLRIY